MLEIDARAVRLGVALLIGLVMGLERERLKGRGTTRGAAGLRTFALVGLLGGVVAVAESAALQLVAALFVAAASLTAYVLGPRRDPGLTSEVALVLCFALGALAQLHPELALGAAVVATCLLAARAPMHHFAHKILTPSELRDGLVFAIVALVVLPLLPDRALDPYGLLNPASFCRLALLVMGLAAAGHVAQRLLGSQFGPPVAGFAAGFVSCSGAIAMLGGAARREPQLQNSHALGAIAAILAALVYLALLLAAANMELLQVLWPPLASSSLVVLLYGWALARRTTSVETGELTPGRAFDLRVVLLFALLVAGFAALSGVLTVALGRYGALGAAAATGLIDLHAAGVSVATLAAAGRLDVESARHAVLFALTANMAIKFVAAFGLGPRGYAWRVSGALAAVIVTFWVATLVA